MADSRDTLRRYLADHDVPCPACGYNLRGLEGEVCPECGDVVALRAYPDAERLDDAARTALYLRDHDVVCRRCRVSLRGTDGLCPGCGRRYVAAGVPPLERLAPAAGAGGLNIAVWAIALVPVLVVAVLVALLLGVMLLP
jgi:hypothetical protein